MPASRPLALLAAALVAALPFTAQAQDYLTGYGGWFDLIDKDDQALQLGAEYRFDPVDFGIRPVLGFNFTTDGSVYGYGGLNWDVQLLPNQLYLIPNFMVGLYGEGDGKDLGGAVEFRSGIEIAYQLANRDRIGLAFNHISNASIYSKNPGAETLMLTYSVPMGQLLNY